MTCNVQVLKEAKIVYENGWAVCLHWAKYQYTDDRPEEYGYRFMWRYPGGAKQGARGQARIPSRDVMNQLLAMAEAEGWGQLGDGA